jgi:hypothetical protein
MAFRPGLLSVQYITGSIVNRTERQFREFSTLIILHLFFTGSAVLGHWCGLGSSAFGFLWGLSTAVVIVGQILLSGLAGMEIPKLWYPLYAFGQFVPALVGTELAVSLLDTFVPLVRSSEVKYTDVRPQLTHSASRLVELAR